MLSFAICFLLLVSFMESLCYQPSRFGLGTSLSLCTETIPTNYSMNLKEGRKESTGRKQNGTSDLISHAYRYTYAYINKYTILL